MSHRNFYQSTEVFYRMATQNQPPKRGRNDLIECPNCHEQYSPTYRRCPFCKEAARIAARPAPSAGTRRPRTEGEQGERRTRSSEEQGERRTRSSEEQGERRTRSSEEQGERRARSSEEQRERRPRTSEGSGRRVARTTRGGGYGRSNHVGQIIFFAVTIILIISACVVVGKVVGPWLNRDADEDEVESSTSTTVEPDDTTVPDIVVTPPVEDVVPETEVIAITLSHADVTLSSGESFTLTAALTPSDADDAVVWTSSSSAATVSLTGLVTNTNTGSSSVTVTVTATVGDVTAECIVRCKPVGGTTSSSSTSSGTGNATVVASGGLNVRSAPSTDGTLVGSLANGSSVTILSTPTSGWYEISYYGESGGLETGYASSSYIQAN